MILGTDISHFQGQPDFARIKAGGRDFVVLKATEGTTYIDPVFAANRRAAHAAGLIVLIYHFARGGDPAAEAAFFLRTVGPLAVGEGLVLDDEVPAVTPPWVQAWCRAVTAATTVHPLVYMNQSTENTGNWSGVVGDGDGLWLAKYDGTLTQPTGGPWGAPAMKQYTSTGAAAGIAGGVDLDVFYGTDAQLLAYGLGGNPPQPQEVDMDAMQAAQLDSVTQWTDPNNGYVGVAMRGLVAQVQAIAAQVSKVQAPAVDAQALAAALLADPAGVDRLGASIAAHLKLTSS